jgi:hypothetical protein
MMKKMKVKESGGDSVQRIPGLGSIKTQWEKSFATSETGQRWRQ